MHPSPASSRSSPAPTRSAPARSLASRAALEAADAAQALGLDPLIAAECLPEIEAVMVRQVNAQLASGSGERGDA